MSQSELLFKPLTKEQVKKKLDRKNPQNPLHNYIGNEDQVSVLMSYAYRALSSSFEYEGIKVSNRVCPNRIAIIGPPSVGKTTLIKGFSNILKLPFCQISAELISSAEYVYEKIVQSLEKYEIQIEEDEGIVTLPPCILFIDEVHMIKPTVQDTLLTLTEVSDATLVLDDIVVKFSKVCIFIGTTSSGKLRKAFKTRFDIIALEEHTEEQLSTIVQMNNSEFSKSICEQIAKAQRIPRKALAFSNKIKLMSEMEGLSYEKSLDRMIKYENIQLGLPEKCVNTLKLLNSSERGLSKKNLCISLGIEEEEFDEDCLPYLLKNKRNQSAYVEIGTRHKITNEGISLVSRLN